MPFVPVGLVAGTPQWCDSQGGPGDARGVDGWFKFTFGTLAEVTGEHNRTELEAQVTDEEQQRNAHRPPLDALAVDMDVGDREGKSTTDSSAEFASNNYALDGPRGVLELARDEERHTRVAGLEGVFVEEHSAVVLGDHVEIVLQRLVVAKTHTFLHADYMPRAIELACQQTQAQPPTGSGIPGKKL